MRTLVELREVADPAWPHLEAAVAACGRARVLPVESAGAEECLVTLQVTAGSALGALALHTGGLVIDNWLRHLGGGSEQLPSLAAVNNLDPQGHGSVSPHLLVAFDVLGGRFAIDGGGLGRRPGEVHYWGPDTLSWAPLGVEHGAFVSWSLTEAVDDFYADLRWADWRQEVARVGLDEGLSVYPPLCTTESRPIANTSRRPVPWEQLSDLLNHLARVPEGPMRLRVGQ